MLWWLCFVPDYNLVKYILIAYFAVCMFSLPPHQNRHSCHIRGLHGAIIIFPIASVSSKKIQLFTAGVCVSTCNSVYITVSDNSGVSVCFTSDMLYRPFNGI